MSALDALFKRVILTKEDFQRRCRVRKIIEGYGPIGADGKKELKLVDAKSKVTLRHLLTHSAGLAYYWNHPLMVEYYKPSEGEAQAILPFATGLIEHFASPAVQEAGVSMAYSPVTDWLGQVRNLPSLTIFL